MTLNHSCPAVRIVADQAELFAIYEFHLMEAVIYIFVRRFRSSKTPEAAPATVAVPSKSEAILLIPASDGCYLPL